MRVAVVSDVHGNLVALEAVVRDLREQAPDLVLHGGDLAVTGPRPGEVVDRMRELGWDGVVGNTEEMLWRPDLEPALIAAAPGLAGWLQVLFRELGPWAAERLGEERILWLRGLPEQRAAGELTLVHASPGDLWQAPLPTATAAELERTYRTLGGALAVYGHIHRPFVRAVRSQTVANAGSAGLPWDGDPRASYLLLEGGTAMVRRVEYDLDAARRDVRDSGFPRASWLAAVQASGRFRRP